ncbi:hypothetical protein W97_01600 [Coniosporium apollinis CBS 100218]|uniref:F-box domain-containing protein n=1 Tax=Coniosporium apollinis (strain CBS 100218) TaxID=1168221 RepID=R7YKG0_CONA1|nr:uncharacterized protein W97_01600 [Coniosporium apollinis CBS 100218]EON62378.1 hypothetical protein W97_01600 [Coniosporium apollinis CBS 100218]
MSLLGIPQELLNTITKDLDYASITLLRWTCKSLYHKVDVANNTGARERPRDGKIYNMYDLIQLELWPCYDPNWHGGHGPKHSVDSFACSSCLKIRPARHFSNAMVRGRRGKESQNPAKLRRFCIACGVKTRQYRPGMKLRYGRSNGCEGGCALVCPKCHWFKTVSSEAEMLTKSCGDCSAGDDLQ